MRKNIKLPVCMCLDTSNSMAGRAISELNAGLKAFYNILSMAALNDEVDTAIITFGFNRVECVKHFLDDNKAPELQAGGMTPIGEAVNLALDIIEAQLNAYIELDNEFYAPWLVVMTDGYPNGNPVDLRRAAARINNSELSVFAIAVGSDADIDILEKFSPKRSVKVLKGLKFKAFFKWLAENIIKTLSKKNGEDIELSSVSAWSE